MVDTDDIVGVYPTGSKWTVDLWTAEGDPIPVGSWPNESTARQAAVAIADAVRGWIEAGR